MPVKLKKLPESKPSHDAAAVPSTSGNPRLHIVARVLNALQEPDMRERLAALRLGAVDATGTESVVALVTDLKALSSGAEGEVYAEAARGLFRKVFDANLDHTAEEPDAMRERARVLRVFSAQVRVLIDPGRL